MVQLPTKTLTLQEFLLLPETKPASEYINGRVIRKPMPQGKHSILQGELVSAINALVRPQRVALAFPELRCTFGGRSVVPDIAVFVWERIVRDENGDVANVFEVAPDWTIEILSPDQSPTRVTGNILHCLNHGASLGWLIDPGDRSVLVYPVGQQPEILQNEHEILPVPNFISGFQLTVGQLFGWLRL
ncbi:Uma2 family endonuclease [Aetokthonos hydrillicola Thurmond2011]|jgi:Uma2 family endonuclease|uniref:Uma2 family endonuclease n=1 Tax=Aetokthonos hydrillicola Thurmond2011 TaxID=2712845 RepID=A0AAP5ICE0_9CYAN|nr:Uma2 family endonuclease [Aetokthonos hydrillicola]MBO3461080.1 Uma2 family endonuclease [Aetokthonos hydrillicola CCALA 1050]MBW4586334.1 Uma2 family endonuclease [Aetokthonos hydrillicola CCALA 1050]MDR9897462.1 Uma2 family endonuclease [Aetokthonos hydrillicola Thurmond2011]